MINIENLDTVSKLLYFTRFVKTRQKERSTVVVEIACFVGNPVYRISLWGNPVYRISLWVTL